MLGGLPAGKNKWQGGVLGRDGNIYCIPCDASAVLCVHVATGELLSLHGQLGELEKKFQGACVHAGISHARPHRIGAATAHGVRHGVRHRVRARLLGMVTATYECAVRVLQVCP